MLKLILNVKVKINFEFYVKPKSVVTAKFKVTVKFSIINRPKLLPNLT